MFRLSIVAIFTEVFFEGYITWNLKFYMRKLSYFDIMYNISFKEHFPEDAHSRWPKHVAG